jgi:hypothetical protein
MKTWQDIGFTWERTADDSPTLSLGPSLESMHHSGGALAETLIIYGEPLREIFATITRPRIFSLGLGLGYVEMVAAAHSLRSGREFEMLTMESVPALVESFDDWLFGRLESQDERNQGLSEVARMIAEQMQVSGEDLRETLHRARANGSWRIDGALAPGHLPAGRFHGFMYDAFSSKTSPELWSENFLKDLLAASALPDCFFTTYACTGNLKRALRSEGFQFVPRAGFRWRRDSTVGRRGLFISLPNS